jgi:hypothetical protein
MAGPQGVGVVDGVDVVAGELMSVTLGVLVGVGVKSLFKTFTTKASKDP